MNKKSFKYAWVSSRPPRPARGPGAAFRRIERARAFGGREPVSVPTPPPLAAPQVLDKLKAERERGITIDIALWKARARETGRDLAKKMLSPPVPSFPLSLAADRCRPSSSPSALSCCSSRRPATSARLSTPRATATSSRT